MTIHGSVNLLRQPVVALEIIGDDGQHHTIEASLDTGFSGDITLPRSAIDRLSLRLIDRANRFRIGDGALTLFNTYSATIRWLGEIRHIAVLETDVFPLIGVGLLWGNNLSADFRNGGDVAITQLANA